MEKHHPGLQLSLQTRHINQPIIMLSRVVLLVVILSTLFCISTPIKIAQDEKPQKIMKLQNAISYLVTFINSDVICITDVHFPLKIITVAFYLNL